ncbi:PqqD family peptide modification chaperone [Zoogloea dura]|uniref:PqqD family peptide modification chaperone n=1 Tax=Zoogloea dura TaxID=2728840 RepID=A0A848G047_9RHOO|nr:PqqD family peptide modification chaperone [Zoogloea dura]NML24400.1 PqqD family peptide modification chaperone [Zoogloea dura]
MTATGVFSPHWYRVAGLHPRLRAHVGISRQIHRDEIWHVIADPVSGRYHRLNAAAYAFVGRCDGNRTIQAVADALLAEAPETALTQDEIVRLLVQLNQRGLIQCEVTPDVAAIFQRSDEERRQRRRQGINPLAFRVRLGNPGPLLKRFDRWRYVLFSWQSLLLWLLLLLAGGLVAATHRDELLAAGHTWLGTPRFLLLAWLLYPPMKALHELAHGLAVRRFGGEVHHVGVSLLLLTPAPYVDASAASAMPRAGQRVVVSAAGIAAELAMTALALMVWATVQPGLVRDVALVVAIVGGTSTLLFNGNPLLRFDGYHVMCDAFDLPNLAPRSQAWWRHLVLNRLLGMAHVPSPEPGRGEGPWLFLYAPLSWLYRIVLSVAIVGWAGSLSILLGLLVGGGLAFALVGKPLIGLWRDLLRMPLSDTDRRRAQGTAVALALAVLVVLAGVPLPFATVARGIVWIPEQARIRAGADGFITAFGAPHGAAVVAGQTLLTLHDPRLDADAAALASQLEGLQSDLHGAMQRDPVKVRDIEAGIRQASIQLERVRELQGLLSVEAGVGGYLAMPRQADLEGGFAPRGALLGHILTGQPAIVRVAVEQDSAALVRSTTRSASVRFADAPGEAWPARLLRAVPAATETLPDAALADFAGGPFATDPADRDHLRTPRPVFVFDLQVDGQLRETAGGRVWVRFDHGWTPLAIQWGRQLKQVFLRHFNPST